MKPLFEPESSNVRPEAVIATANSRVVRRSIGPGEVEFLAGDFSLVCTDPNGKTNSMVKKLSALYKSNSDTDHEKKHNALFHPDKKPATVVSKVTSLFGFGDQGGSPICAPLEATTRANKSNAIHFVDTAPIRNDPPKVDLPTIQSFYRNHKLNAGRDESFVLLVQEIDTKVNLDSAITIVRYGSSIQESIGTFLERASGYGSQLTAIGLNESAANIMALMSSMSVEHFMKKKKTGFFSSGEYTINDYINIFSDVDSKLNQLISSAVSQATSIIQMIESSERMVDEHATLVAKLDAHVVAGKIVMERNSAKAFRDHNEEFLMDQFEQRLVNLATYENLCVVSFEQIKLVQRQMISMASMIQNVATVMYPLWKTSVSTLMTRWQGGGNMTKETTIPSLMSDNDFVSITKQTEMIINTLNNKG